MLLFLLIQILNVFSACKPWPVTVLSENLGRHKNVHWRNHPTPTVLRNCKNYITLNWQLMSHYIVKCNKNKLFSYWTLNDFNFFSWFTLKMWFLSNWPFHNVIIPTHHFWNVDLRGWIFYSSPARHAFE